MVFLRDVDPPESPVGIVRVARWELGATGWRQVPLGSEPAEFSDAAPPGCPACGREPLVPPGWRGSALAACDGCGGVFGVAVPAPNNAGGWLVWPADAPSTLGG